MNPRSPVAEAGERSDLTIKSMTTSQFSLANRKQLADMLGHKYEGLRQKAKEKFSSRRDELRASYIKELAKGKGALTVYQRIDDAKDRIEELELELAGLGFKVDYNGDLELNGEGVSLYDKTIGARVEKEIGTMDDIDSRFDSAQIAMMTVASLEDADKLLKSVSSI
jgi:C-terminal processing protease CtpA/Prc